MSVQISHQMRCQAGLAASALPSELSRAWCLQGSRTYNNIFWLLCVSLAWRLPSCWELNMELAECTKGAQNVGLSSLAGLEEPGNLCTEPGSGQTLS